MRPISSSAAGAGVAAAEDKRKARQARMASTRYGGLSFIRPSFHPHNHNTPNSRARHSRNQTVGFSRALVEAASPTSGFDNLPTHGPSADLSLPFCPFCRLRPSSYSTRMTPPFSLLGSSRQRPFPALFGDRIEEHGQQERRPDDQRVPVDVDVEKGERVDDQRHEEHAQE